MRDSKGNGMIIKAASSPKDVNDSARMVDCDVCGWHAIDNTILQALSSSFGGLSVLQNVPTSSAVSKVSTIYYHLDLTVNAI